MTLKQLFNFLFWRRPKPGNMIELFDDASVIMPETRRSIQEEHSVLVEFYYPFEELEPLFELEDCIYEVLLENEAGCYDGHEICLNTNEATLFFYGTNAETLFKTVKPLLDDTIFLKGAVAFLTFGPDHETACSIEVEIGN